MLKKVKLISVMLAAVIILSSCTVKETDVIAWVENSPAPDITYGEFLKEYRLALYIQGIDEESDPYNAMVTRSEVINYQINEQVQLRIAEDMGIGISSLTAEDYAQIEINTAQRIADVRENLTDEARSAFPNEPTEEQLNARITMLYERFLRESGIDEEFIRKSCTSEYITSRLWDTVIDTVTLSDEEFDAFIKQQQEEAWADITVNPNLYTNSYTNYELYIPEGCRSVKHILIKLDDDVSGVISEIRAQGSHEDADDIRDSVLEDIRGRAENALARLEDGEDFEAVMREVSNDRGLILSEEGVYRIAPGFTLFGQEYHDAVFALSAPGEYTGLIPTDFGWVIILFEAYTMYTDEEWKEILDELKELRLSFMKHSSRGEFNALWQEQYPYEIDNKKLRIDF
ncbi:MAG: peptidylprolyl isomerase [Oscillospiraceae bacterium]|nr:peptidylprolyl isomerase [Oscillospiraceae bacterium]